VSTDSPLIPTSATLTELTPAEIRSELEKILASKGFTRSERLSRFLRFLVEQALRGSAEKLKEYALGLDVFDRRPSYDPRLDPIVRVEARRLRVKLQDYYRTDGSGDPVCIELPERGYAPAFRRQDAVAPQVRERHGPVSIAVLPFLNLSPDRENEYFSDGLTEELIGTLAKIETMRVVARTSVFQLKGKSVDIRYAGAQLNADILLEGSVRREGDRVRISAQLVNVADGYHLWSDTYEREMKGVFAMQEEIAQAITGALKTRLGIESQKPLVQRHPEDIEAYNFYLQARYYLALRTEAGFHRSLECFRNAIRRDPKYALAHAGLADAYSLSTRYDVLPPQEAWPKAKTAVLRALELDDGLAEAHTALAFVKLHYEWDWPGSAREFARALDINPNYALAHQWNSWALAVLGRFEDAIASMKRARVLDPLSQNVSADLALAYYFARQYEDAIGQCHEVIDLQPGFHRPHQLLGMIYLQQGLYPEAVAELQQAAVMSDPNRKVIALLACAEALSGRHSEAECVLAELQGGKRRYVSAVDVALIYSALGDRDRMFEWLDKAYDEHDGELVWLGIDPIHDRVREDLRFRNLLGRIARHSAAEALT
jgi:TolB-like protein/cytochrome c-type biogenesis protein CcmH/NrfG